MQPEVTCNRLGVNFSGHCRPFYRLLIRYLWAARKRIIGYRNNEKHFQYPLLSKEELPAAKRYGADHGPHHHQRTTGATLHPSERRTVALGYTERARSRTYAICDTDECSLGKAALPSDGMLRAAFFQNALRYPRYGQNGIPGQDNAKRNLLTFFAHHNAHFFHMVGVSRSIHTYNKYRSVHKHLRQYIRERYGRPDIGFSEITPEFVTGFHAFLSQQARCSANTIWIYLIAFKHILKLACSEGLLRRNPLGDYKLHSEFVSRNFLTLDELNRILALDLHDRTMQLVRDGFIFSCFTGLSYSDLCNLTRRHVEQTGDQWWIRTKRCKTGTPVTVRLFELPAAILRNHALGREDDPIFTLPSNGWCNACLDKIAARAGIPKKITFHVARHTFATTITLSQGVTIETISKLLGHKNIRTTQIYATITHAKLSGELEQLSRRIDTLFDRTNMQSRGGL